MTDDATKRAILARRARFIAAAVAGAGISLAGCREAGPEVCLSAVPVNEKSKGEGDAGASTSAGSGEPGDANVAEVAPMPCLSPLPAACLSETPVPLPATTKPTVCLKPAWPRDAGKP